MENVLEVIDDLAIVQCRWKFGHSSPLEIESVRVYISVFDPASFQQSLSNVRIISFNDENSARVSNPVDFLPPRDFNVAQRGGLSLHGLCPNDPKTY